MNTRSWLTMDFFWLAAVLTAGSMQYWFPNFRPGISHDSYSTKEDGKKAFYLLLRHEAESRGLEMARSFHPLDRQIVETNAREIPSRLNLRNPPALCILGPHRDPSPEEWDRILNWVQAGGTLVFAARDDRPDVEIPQLDIAIRGLDNLQEARVLEDDTSLVRTSLLAEGNLYWETSGWVDAPRAEPLVQFAGTVQAVLQEHGYGRVIVIATDFLFSNQSMAWQDNPVLAFALVTARPANPIQPHRPIQQIALDESLNASGIPKVMGVLLDPRLRPLSIQFATLALVFAWWRSRRFGPLLPPPVPPRRNIVDHTDALGVHAYQAKDGAVMLRAYLHQFEQELKLQGTKAKRDRAIEPIARRLGKPGRVILGFLEHAEAAARQKRLRRREAADLIRRLAILRHASRRDSQI